jgi:heterodisulfide reductase subunit D
MKIFNKIFKGNTLYYPGCLTKFVLKDIQNKYEEVLKKQGIDFIVLKDKELCCGSPVKNAGAEKEFKELAEKNLKIFKEHGVDKIITNCPACAAVFRNDYKEVLGEKWKIKVNHILELIETDNLKTRKEDTKRITYHDSCHLGRVLGVYDQPREIIKKMGNKLVEMDLHGQKSFCCGGGGGVKSNYSNLSNEIAKDRMSQAKKTEADCLITACPMCYVNLKENSNDLEVKEISDIL